MLQKLLPIAFTIFSLCVQGQTILFEDGFESGSLKSGWTARPGASGGLVQVVENIQGITKTSSNGFFAVGMGRTSDGALTTNQLDLKLNLAGQTQVGMSFSIWDNSEETHSQDGIYFSNDGGTSFKKVYDFKPDLWNNAYGSLPALDVDKLASTAGLTLTSNFIIRFQQYDNADFISNITADDKDGFFIDDVSVYVPAVTYATLPFSDGFEGVASNSWDRADAFRKGNTGAETTILPDATVEVVTSNESDLAHTGFNAVALGRRSDGNFATNALDLHLNLAGQTQVEMSFWIWDNAEDTHSQDGIYFSSNGGTSFKKVYDFKPDLWNNAYGSLPALDVDKLALDAGLILTNNFVVRFQQYDNADFISTFTADDKDGFFIDDVSVYVPAVSYASLPFSDSFEDTSLKLGNSWLAADAYRRGNTGAEASILPDAAVEIIKSTNGDIAKTGYNAVALGRRSDGNYVTNALDLYLNYAGQTQLVLTFWMWDNADESHVQDGIYLSIDEGKTFTKIYSFLPETYPDSYQFYNLNIKQLALDKSISLADKVVIRFQQYDNADFESTYTLDDKDGFIIDDVQVNSTEINVKQGTTNIFTGGTFAFGNQSTAVPTTFTIENLGVSTLSLTGSPIVAITGTNANEFSINQTATSASVASNASTTFIVTFVSSSAGNKTAKLSIANNDSDENPYEINLTGIGASCTNPAKPTISQAANTSFTTSTLTSSAAPTGGTYQWLLGGTAIPGATSQSYTATKEGSYSVRIGVGGCSTTSDPFVLVVTAVEDVANASVSVYPNPAKDQLNISLAAFQGKKKVAVFNATGQQITAEEVTTGETNINVADYPQGIYLVKIATSQGVSTVKFLKQ